MKHFILDTTERAVKTFCQSMLANISFDGLMLSDINWVKTLSVSIVAALVSVLTSVISYNFKGDASLVSK